MPDTIQFGNGRQIINSYDAGGHKLTTQYYTPLVPIIMLPGNIFEGYTTSNSVLRLDDYCGSYLYENGTSASVHPLTKILTPEGYVDMSTSGYPYCYYKQDHLGSNREVTSYAGTTGTVVQQTEYYPSGTAYVEGTGAGIQPFKFTGKELIIMHGLNWQDFGARWLDNVRMQWTTMDPLCEKYYAISPYTYCSDDPARFVDKDGKIITIPNEKDRKQILTMVNSRAAGTFGINKQGELYVIKKEGTSGYSTYYRDRLIQAIGSKDKVNININSLVTVSGGKVINVDKVAGGGITLTGAIKNSETGKILGKWASVTISGNKNETQKDSNGNTLISESKDILMHELVGHSIPAIVGSDTGNAVDDENKVRAQYPEGQNQQRQRDPDHIE